MFDPDSSNFSRPGTAGEERPASRCSRSVGRGGGILYLENCRLVRPSKNNEDILLREGTNNFVTLFGYEV